VKIYFDNKGNQFCGVNNFATKLHMMLKDHVFSNRVSILNVHYPMQSMSFSLHIILRALFFKLFKRKSKVVLTLHEYKSSSLLRKLSAKLLLSFSDKVVVTNEEEKIVLENSIKGIEVIPIFSNIQCNVISAEVAYKKHRILFFGNFYPARKIDYIIDEFKKYNNKMFELYICGSPNDRHKDYYNMILEQCKHDENIVVKTELSQSEVCDIASESFAAIGIYSDGLSVKRGSALMFLAMGLPLISNRGHNTDELLVNPNCFYEYDGFENCINYLKDLSNYQGLSNIGKRVYEENFSEKLIAKKYIQVFENV